MHPIPSSPRPTASQQKHLNTTATKTSHGNEKGGVGAHVTTEEEVKGLLDGWKYSDQSLEGNVVQAFFCHNGFRSEEKFILKGLHVKAPFNVVVPVPENISVEDFSLKEGHLDFHHGDVTETTSSAHATALGDDALVISYELYQAAGSNRDVAFREAAHQHGMALLKKVQQSNSSDSSSTLAIAVKFLAKAAMHGNSLSLKQLGEMPLDEKSMEVLTNTFHQEKSNDLLFKLGETCLEGKKYQNAAVCFQQAASHGHRYASEKLNEVYEKMRIAELEDGHKNGNLDASIALGEKHLRNSWANGNYAKAALYFEHVVKSDPQNENAQELLSLAKDLATIEEKSGFLGKIHFYPENEMFCKLAMKFQPAPHQNEGIATDRNKAIAYYRKGADAGSGFAAYMLSNLLMTDSISNLKRASELGYVTASLELGNWCSSISDEIANSRMYSPTASGDAVRYLNLAITQENNEEGSITKNAQTKLKDHLVVQELIKKSKAGDSTASNTLALHYLNGTCSRSKNQDVATKYSEIASRQGSGEASYRLSEKQKDPLISLKFLSIATEQGCPEALIKLADKYVNNEGVKKVSDKMVKDLGEYCHSLRDKTEKSKVAFLLGELCIKRSFIKSEAINGEYSDGIKWFKLSESNGLQHATAKLFLLQKLDTSLQVTEPKHKTNNLQ